MSINRSNIQTKYTHIDDFEIKAGDFEGPLELLLYLVKEAKVQIRDIFISNITEQYLLVIAGMDVLNLDKTSEFLEVATILLEIKAKSMLPSLDEMMPQESGEDLKERFLRKLEEYKLFKEASDKLKETENVNYFYREPDESVNDYRYILRDMTMDALMDAFSKLLHKVEIKKSVTQPKKIIKDRFTVAEKIIFIWEIAKERKSISFFELFERDYSKGEVITTFLALLEILKLQYVRAEQSGLFEDITLYYTEGINGN